MKRNPIYESLVDKSIGSMLSAIEIYNKPDFKYREETFAILTVNAWELLFKARLLKLSKYKMNSIYCYKAYVAKDGTRSKKKKVLDYNRTGNPKSISIFDAQKRLIDLGELPKSVNDNIDSLIELRDNAVHFINSSSISKQIQELGFACVKNYIGILKRWYRGKDLGQYNLYLMPLAYIDGKKVVASIVTKEEQNFLGYVRRKLLEEEKDENFDIAIKIELNFHKGNSFEGTPIRFDKDGLPVNLSEEEIRNKFPWTYNEVCKRAKSRYSDFKQGQSFNLHMLEIKQNEKLCYHRKLDPKNPRSQGQSFYSTNIWIVLDKYYDKKKDKI